jgi:hypothetical protein
MTKLRTSVIRETEARIWSCGAERPIVAGLKRPGILTLRLKGERSAYALRLNELYYMAAKNRSFE